MFRLTIAAVLSYTCVAVIVHVVVIVGDAVNLLALLSMLVVLLVWSTGL